VNKKLVIAGIVLLAVAKILILKFVLIDLPSYDKCTIALSSSTTRGLNVPGCTDVSVIPFVAGWVLLAVGAGLLIFGLKADSVPKSRLV
jgi:hypothetical protein